MSALLTSLSFYMTLPLSIVRDGHALASNAHHLASLGTFPLLILPLCLESAVPAVSRIRVYKPFSGPLRGQAIQAPLLLLSTFPFLNSLVEVTSALAFHYITMAFQTPTDFIPAQGI